MTQGLNVHLSSDQDSGSHDPQSSRRSVMWAAVRVDSGPEVRKSSSGFDSASSRPRSSISENTSPSLSLPPPAPSSSLRHSVHLNPTGRCITLVFLTPDYSLSEFFRSVSSYFFFQQKTHALIFCPDNQFRRPQTHALWDAFGPRARSLNPCVVLPFYEFKSFRIWMFRRLQRQTHGLDAAVT